MNICGICELPKHICACKSPLKAGIGVDNWKLSIFRKRLTEAGYKYKDGGALTADTTLLTVETDDILGLKKVLEACQLECKKKGKPND